MNAVEVKTDIVYADPDGVALALDLYLPNDVENPPAVVYFHGGGWQLGDKSDSAPSRLAQLAANGIGVVSVNYRLAPVTYPAPIHDAKAAVRWVRAHGSEFGLATDRVGAWGASAGAYLATMLGLTSDDPELEGQVGSDLDQSSSVDGVVHWFGPSNLVANSRRSWIEQQLLIPPFEVALLGTEQIADSAAVWTASPLSRISRQAPPFLICHGDHDRITPISESFHLHDALVRAGATSTMITIGGVGHEDPAFDRPDNIAMTAAFLRAVLAT